MPRHRFEIFAFIFLALFSSAAPSFAATDPDLVGLWHMNGDWTDASGNGNNGTPYNGVTFSASARVGSHAGSFDGVNDYVTVKSSAIIANSSQSTIEAWVNPASFGSVRRIYSENSSGGAVFVLSIESAGGAALSIWRTDISGNWVTVTSDTILQLNSWSHVVGTLDAGGMKIYVNGVLVGTNTTNNLPSNGSITEVVFGRLNNGGGVEYFSGLLDEAAVYSRALTAAEISKSYNAGLGRVALWHMNGDWTDATGNGNHGTAFNGAAFSTNARVGSHAGSFDGVDDYASGNTAGLPLASSPRTISAWVKAGSGTQNRAIIRYGAGSSSDFQLFVDASNRAAAGNGNGSITGTSSLSDGRWHYVVGVYEGSGTNTARIYVDGVLQNSGTITTLDTANGSFSIGAFSGGGGYFNGLIDEVAVYNRVHTVDEITKSYNDGLGRIGLWRMDGDWTDATGNGNTGTAYNGAAFSTVARVGSHAGTFDGVNDYTNVKSSALVANSAQNSVEAWVYLTAIGSASKTIYAENSSGGVVFTLGVAPTGKPFFAVWRSDVPGNWLTAESGAPVSINQWHHIVGTLDGSGMKIYVNGSLSGMHTNTSPSNGTITEVSIGRVSNLGGTDFLAGKIDEVAVYKRALTAEEIQAYYNHLTPPTVAIHSPLSGVSNNRTPLLNYSVSHGTVTVKVDGVVVNKLSGDTLGPFADGPHTIKVEAVNDAGLTGFAEVTYTVQSLPLITINTVTTPTNLSSQTISGSRSLDGTVSVAINTTASASIVTYPTPTTWSCAISNLAQAANDITVTVTAPDNQTNTAVTSISYYVLSLSNVTVSANTINTFASESATIFFTLNGPATVTLKMIPEKSGSSGTPIYQTSKTISQAGASYFIWDGRDNTGTVVADDAYLYILEAADGVKAVSYNPSASSSQINVTCTPEAGSNPYRNDPLTIGYSLSLPARVTIKIDWGTGYFKPLDAVPHSPGAYSFDWDGRDSAGNILVTGVRKYCYAMSALSENYIITNGAIPKISQVKTDPYQVSLSYGEITRIKYLLSRDAIVTIQLKSPSGATITLIENQPQTAGQHEIEWNGLDASDTTSKKFIVSQESNYTAVIQATNPFTGSSSTARGNLVIRH